MSKVDRVPLERCVGMSADDLDAQIRVRREMFEVTTGGWLARSMTVEEIPELEAMKARIATPTCVVSGPGEPGGAVDQNKLAVLKSIGYQIRATCGLCKHARLEGEWGVCTRDEHEYRHAKHTGAPRKLSTFRSGWCDKFQAQDGLKERLQGFSEFMEGS